MYKEEKARPALTFTSLLRIISATGLAYTSAPRDPFLLSLILKMAAGVSKMAENPQTLYYSTSPSTITP